MKPTENESQTNIYSEVVVICNNEREFSVVRIKEGQMQDIECGITDLKIALAIRKAYCDGYYDGQRE